MPLPPLADYLLRRSRPVVLTTSAVFTSLAIAIGSTGVAHADPGDVEVMQEPPIDFQLPFECGQPWAINIGAADHNPALDMARADDWNETLGSPLLAPADGTVNRSELHENAGNMIQIDHGQGYFTTYIHLDSREVNVGDSVSQGDLIGAVGMTGETSNDVPHLHYELAFDADDKGYATWGDVGTDRIVAWFDGEEYDAPNGHTWESVESGNCGDDGEPDPEPEPEPEGTELEYSGPEAVANGEPAELSGTLTDETGAAVTNQTITFTLGTGDNAQTCEGTTNTEGTTNCTINTVDQPLNDNGTVPLTLTFDGDDYYEPSEASDEVLLEHVTGSAFGLSADVPLLGLPISLGPEPETGDVRTASTETVSPECSQSVGAILVTADVLCAQVDAETDPTSATASTSVSEVGVGLPGLPVIGLSGVEVSSTSTCEEQTGSVDMTLTVAGVPVDIGETPNLEVDLGGLVGTRLVVNEQVREEDGSLTVNGAHLTAPGGVDIVIGSATSAAHNCA